MTRQVETAYIKPSPFSQWLRSNTNLLSRDGYTAHNLDYIWRNYKLRKLMLIEEKCRMSHVTRSQRHAFQLLHESLRTAPPRDWTYCGFHLVQFEKEGPEDGGGIYLNGQSITVTQLEQFLAFTWMPPHTKEDS